MTVYRGHLVHLTGNPTLPDAPRHLVGVPDGAIVVDDAGRISYSGDFSALPPAADVVDVRPGFLLPGFIDTHIHFPQTHCANAFGGGQLLNWLERCIFPAESALADPLFARKVARDFCSRRISVGTTTALVFGSAFPDAQDALFEESLRAGLRTISGRGIQTVGPDSARLLTTSERAALELVGSEISRWHAADTRDPETALLHAAVVPRFALSVTRRTLAALGELYDGVRGSGVYFHTHVSENVDEIAAVRAMYDVDSYLDTYDGRFGPGSSVQGRTLLGPRSVLAHAVHSTDDELARMADTGTSIAHCPTSQLFLGSGTMPWRRTVSRGVNVALGSDVAAGDEWLVPRVLNDCFKVHISEPAGAAVSLNGAELLYTATIAGARALALNDRIGNLDVGKEADFVVIDPGQQEVLAETLARIDPVDTAALLFTLLTGMREAAVASVFVRGRKLR